MATDRGAALSVRAAVRGVLDFREAEIFDPRWWRRTRLLMNAMSQEDSFRIMESAQRYHLALLGRSELDENAFRSIRQNALETHNDITQLLRPWDEETLRQAKKQEAEQLTDMYRREIGDMKDPEFRKRIEAEAKRMLSEVEEQQEASPEEVVQRRFYDRVVSQRRR